MSTLDHDPNLTPIEPQVKAIVDALIKHEHESHNGERCSKERANVIGYLAHRLLTNSDEWMRALDVFVAYTTRHAEHQAARHACTCSPTLRDLGVHRVGCPMHAL